MKTDLPRTEDSRGLRHVQSWCGVIVIESDDQAGDTERSNPTTLRVFLSQHRNVNPSFFVQKYENEPAESQQYA